MAVYSRENTILGRYSDRRVRARPIFTAALSLRQGRLPWPAVPLALSLSQVMPFSPTVMVMPVSPRAPVVKKPPSSVII